MMGRTALAGRLLILAAVPCAALVQRASAAVLQPPTVHRISSDAAVFGNSLQTANMIVVRTSAGLVVVDNFTRPELTAQMLDSAGRFWPGQRPVLLINTHAHADATNSNQLFASIPILAHASATRELVAAAPRIHDFLGAAPATMRALEDSLRMVVDSPTTERQRARLASLQGNYALYQGVTITPPTISISSDTTVTIGDTEILIIVAGPAHTAGDLAIVIPAQKLMAIGDLARPNGMVGGHDPNHFDPLRWMHSLSRLAALSARFDIEHVVPNNGHVGDPGMLLSTRNLVQQTFDSVMVARSAGSPLDSMRTLRLDPFVSWTYYREIMPDYVALMWQYIDRIR